jgi:hypothetical protein
MSKFWGISGTNQNLCKNICKKFYKEPKGKKLQQNQNAYKKIKAWPS